MGTGRLDQEPESFLNGGAIWPIHADQLLLLSLLLDLSARGQNQLSYA